MAGQLRIIAGQWRGRRLPVTAAAGLRPTADRNRETLFNWLQGDLQGARVLDLFAGTGALGLEALSRGAASAVLVERHRRAASALKAAIEQLDATALAHVITDDALRFLKRPPAAKFDLVFIDPPFQSTLLASVMPLLTQGEWLNPGAQIYLEAASAPMLPEHWTLRRGQSAGGVWYGLAAIG